jgi:hypothetical protein
MQNSSTARSRKRTAFVPRLAYGCFGVGMGVIPLCAGCSPDNGPPAVGIEPYIPADGGFGDSAPSVGILPAMGTGDASFGLVEDTGVSEEASTVGIRPADTADGGADTQAPDASEDDSSRAATDAAGD